MSEQWCLLECIVSKMGHVPLMKDEAHFSINQQLLKVREEVDEAIQAPKEYQAEELGDLLHSVFVLIRVMWRNGINPANALKDAIDKNRLRGYYDEDNDN